MIHIKVPATTANMGPGFDCIGMAFQLYNHIYVEERESGLFIQSKTSDVPQNKEHLIYKTMLQFYELTGKRKEFQGLSLTAQDYIPMTRGLGSSAACIVAGLLAANELCSKKVGRDEIVELAAKIEGHPDNSTPAIVGGMVVGAMNGTLDYIKIPMVPASEKGLCFGVMIPGFQLSTEKARKVLPPNYSREDAVYNTSRGALLAASMLTGDFSKLKTAMDDRIHQPYREKLIPGMKEIFSKAREIGALGTFLSGAGPTLIAVFDHEKVRNGLEDYIAGLEGQWSFHQFMPDDTGAVVERI